MPVNGGHHQHHEETSKVKQCQAFPLWRYFSPVMDIQAVIFDLDDTLFDDFSCTRAGLKAVCEAHDVPAPSRERFGVRHNEIIHELSPLVWCGEITPQQARVRRFERLLTEHGIPNPDGEAATSLYRQAYQTAWNLYPHALEVLQTLRERGMKTAVLTNYPSEVQTEKAAALGLIPQLDAFICTDHIPAPKPDARAFHTACTILHSEPPRTLMVGDSLTADVQGALGAGLKALWFNPRNQPGPEGTREMLELLA